MTLLAGTTTALLSEMSGSHARATLPIPYAGAAVFKAERRQLIGAAGQPESPGAQDREGSRRPGHPEPARGLKAIPEDSEEHAIKRP